MGRGVMGTSEEGMGVEGSGDRWGLEWVRRGEKVGMVREGRVRASK